MNRTSVRSCHINYEDSEKEALRYLESHLDRDEFETIIGYARHKDEAHFQDGRSNHFSIKYKGGEYFLEKK